MEGSSLITQVPSNMITPPMRESDNRHGKGARGDEPSTTPPTARPIANGQPSIASALLPLDLTAPAAGADAPTNPPVRPVAPDREAPEAEAPEAERPVAQAAPRAAADPSPLVNQISRAANLQALLAIAQNPANRNLLRNASVRAAMTRQAVAILSDNNPANDNISGQELRVLAHYIDLPTNLALLSFYNNDRERHIGLAEHTSTGWDFVSPSLSSYNIDASGSELVVRQDREHFFDYRCVTFIVAGAGRLRGSNSTGQMLFHLGLDEARIEAALADGEITQEEVRRENGQGISAALFREMDEDGNGTISRDEFFSFDDLVDQYMTRFGLSEQQAYDIYSNSTSFGYTNFEAVEEAEGRLSRDLVGVNRDNLEARLTSLGIQPQVREIVLAHFAADPSLAVNAETVALSLVCIAESARVGDGFLGIEHPAGGFDIPFPDVLQTTQVMMGWLMGREPNEEATLGAGSRPNAAAGNARRTMTWQEAQRYIRSDAGRNGTRSLYFSATSPQNRTNWRQVAVELASTLLAMAAQGDTEAALVAEMLPEVFSRGGRDREYCGLNLYDNYRYTMAGGLLAGEHPNFERALEHAELIVDAEQQNRALDLVANAMLATSTETANEPLTAARLQRAYECAIRMTGNARDQILARILEICLSAVDPEADVSEAIRNSRVAYLELAYQIVRDNQTLSRRTESIGQLVEAYRNTREGTITINGIEVEARERAFDLLRLLPDNQTIPPPPGSREEGVSPQTRAEQLRDEFRIDNDILRYRDLVFPPGTLPDAPVDREISRALYGLQRLYNAIPAETTDPRQVERRAQILITMGEIIIAQGVERWPSELNEHPRDASAFRLLGAGAYLVYQGVELLQGLRDSAQEGEAGSQDRRYCDTRIAEANGFIGQFLQDNRRSWLPQLSSSYSDPVRFRREVQSAAADLAKYIHRTTRVAVLDEQGRPQNLSSAELKRSVRDNVGDGDNEHSNPTGPDPTNILHAYREIQGWNPDAPPPDLDSPGIQPPAVPAPVVPAVPTPVPPTGTNPEAGAASPPAGTPPARSARRGSRTGATTFPPASSSAEVILAARERAYARLEQAYNAANINSPTPEQLANLRAALTPLQGAQSTHIRDAGDDAQKRAMRTLMANANTLLARHPVSEAEGTDRAQPSTLAVRETRIREARQAQVNYEADQNIQTRAALITAFQRLQAARTALGNELNIANAGTGDRELALAAFNGRRISALQAEQNSAIAEREAAAARDESNQEEENTNEDTDGETSTPGDLNDVVDDVLAGTEGMGN